MKSWTQGGKGGTPGVHIPTVLIYTPLYFHCTFLYFVVVLLYFPVHPCSSTVLSCTPLYFHCTSCTSPVPSLYSHCTFLYFHCAPLYSYCTLTRAVSLACWPVLPCQPARPGYRARPSCYILAWSTPDQKMQDQATRPGQVKLFGLIDFYFRYQI